MKSPSAEIMVMKFSKIGLLEEMIDFKSLMGNK